MQIQISWNLQKPSDPDLHCLQTQGISGFSRTRVNLLNETGAFDAKQLLYGAGDVLEKLYCVGKFRNTLFLETAGLHEN